MTKPSPDNTLPPAPDRWTSFKPDAWRYDPAKHPAWQDPTRTRRRIGAPQELALVAEAIIHKKRLVCTDPDGNEQHIVAEVGDSWDRHFAITEHVCVESLRELIETLQSTDGVCLVRVNASKDAKGILRINQRWNELRENGEYSRTDRSPTRLTLWHCVVERVEQRAQPLSPLDTGLTLNARCLFAGAAGFWGASFAGDARFEDASFAGDARFEDASFAGAARFGRASFAGDAGFWGASFAGDAWFWGAAIHADLILTDAEIERRLELATTTFRRKSRLALNGLIQRAGASILIHPEDLTRIESDRELLARWLRRRKALATKIKGAEATLPRLRARLAYAREYFAQTAQFIATWAVADPLEQLAVELSGKDRVPLGLAVGRRGTLIKGEDADSDTEQGRDALARAARDYNQLRDFFRAQQSTDAHEEICTIKHHDLARRARPRTTIWSYFAGAFHWLVMRNLLGYLVKPSRILFTGLIIMLLCGSIYGAWAEGGTTIAYNGPIPKDFQRDTDGELRSNAYADHTWDHPDRIDLSWLYFSLTTFVTLGYGDFAPLGWFKLITGIEALLGVTLLALFTVAWGRKMVR